LMFDLDEKIQRLEDQLDQLDDHLQMYHLLMRHYFLIN
jgi:hypothetical protein